jgi:hypothetical protein
MNDEFKMKAFPMSDKDIRELSCRKHEGTPVAICLEAKVLLVCKHCGKQMGESDDPVLFEKVLRAESGGRS